MVMTRTTSARCARLAVVVDCADGERKKDAGEVVAQASAWALVWAR